MTMNDVSRNSALTETPLAASMGRGQDVPPKPGRQAPRKLDDARPVRVEHAEALLRVFGHRGHADLAPHEGDPRLLGERLQSGKIPELPLVHFDLSDALLKHPVPQRGQ